MPCLCTTNTYIGAIYVFGIRFFYKIVLFLVLYHPSHNVGKIAKMLCLHKAAIRELSMNLFFVISSDCCVCLRYILYVQECTYT